MKRCLLVAPLVSHATAGRIAALGSGSYELHVADISTRPLRHRMDQPPFTLVSGCHDLHVAETDPLFRPGAGYPVRIADTLRSRRLLPEPRALAERLRAVIREVQPSVVVVYYAAIAIHFGRILRRLFPRLPIVIIHNALPSTLERKGCVERLLRRPFINEFVDYSHWVGRLDYFVHASEGMADFAHRKFGIARARMAILPDYLPRSMHAGDTSMLEGAGERDPRVIFLGAPERWGATIDNPDAEFLSLAREKITVHSGEMGDAVIGTGFGHKYPYFTDDRVYAGDLAQYAHGFDAALITYGINQRRERFRTTLPTRFLSALTAGIPIAVRGGLFDAVEAYVERHGIGFRYGDSRDLRAILGDRERMAAYRRNAIAHLQTIGGETQAAEFDKILGAVAP